MTIVEVTLAMTVITIGALSAISTLTQSSSLDGDLKERSIALRAAMSKVESIVAYDYNDKIINLVNYWQQPANSTFTVEGLAAPLVAGLPAPHGSITFDNSDPLRLGVTVTIEWRTRQGQPRTFTLPRTLTEYAK
jgi:Tfp pilus assembly protein PilV